MYESEELREALVDLERARSQEQLLRIETENILSGLRILALSLSIEEMFEKLLVVFQTSLRFQDAFVLMVTTEDCLRPSVATAAKFSDTVWHRGPFFRRVLKGKPVAIFDVKLVPEWLEQPERVRTGVQSALHIPLQSGQYEALLVCTHEERGFFGPVQVKLAKRLVLLASQALVHFELQAATLERERLFSLSVDMLSIISFDGEIRQLNAAWERTLGFSSDALQSFASLQNLVHPEDQAKTVSSLQELQNSHGESTVFENRLRCMDDSYKWFLWSVTAFAKEQLFYAIVRDISGRKQMEDDLRESEARYELAVRGANDGLWDWNLTRQEIYFSQRWKSMFGYEEHEIGDRPEDWFELVHPDDLALLIAEIDSHIQGTRPYLQCEFRMWHKAGQAIWVLCRGLAVRDASSTPYRMAGSLSDISERKQIEQQLRHDAFHDKLTGLANRALFLDRLAHVAEQAKRNSDFTFAVLFLDFDRFKALNDSLGHQVGDQLLVAIARRFEENLRPTECIARLGGDEFAILLDNIEGEDYAIEIARRLREEMMRPFSLAEHEVFSSASIGIATSVGGFQTPEEILRDADIAMYRAKTLGRARYAKFHPSMHQQSILQLQLDTALRHALEREEFILYYQPIVSLDVGRIVGFEALSRWVHPQKGYLSPEVFIPIAEKTDVIIELDRWVLAEACRQMARWHAQFPEKASLSISVNISRKGFSQPDMVDHVRRVLQEAGLGPQSLRLEITESTIMDSPRVASDILTQLKDAHIQLHMDDFGTGYSSLSNLCNFPVDVLKIDRSFVSNMNKSAKQFEIVRTVVALGQNLHMDLIAEGIESEEQLAQLRELKCGYGQGYYFAKPVPEEGASELIQRDPTW